MLTNWDIFLACCESEYQVLNASNRGPRSSSGYTGVSSTLQCKWRSVIYIQGKQIYLGIFNSPEEAFRAHRIARINNILDSNK